MKKIFTQAISLCALFAAAALLFAPAASAVDVFEQACSGQGGDNAACAASRDDLDKLWQGATQVLLYVVGILAVIMIIVGAIRYVTSNGDQSQITSAKNTILYAVVGLVLAVAAGPIISFVLEYFR